VQLSGLLEKLKGLFTPAFLLSSVAPLFCFILVNAAILGQFSPSVNQWARDYFILGTTEKTVIAGIGSIALLVGAYVFSTLNLSLRQKLEGVKLPKALDRQLRLAETNRFNALEKRFSEARQTRRQLRQKSERWREQLRKARDEGVTRKRPKAKYPEETGTHRALENLEELRRPGASIAVAEIAAAVDLLTESLRKNSADWENADSKRLDRDHILIIDLIKYAQEKIEEEYFQLFNEKEFNFSRYRIVPTRMGNIAESVRSYALSRYGMNLVFFWTRFQKVLQGKAEFYKTIQDAQTQLDFAVSLFWLTSISTAWWLVALPFLSHTWLPLIGVWIFGPLLARAWYLIAVQNYRSFADLLRSSLDLFRFDLLADLKVPLPPDGETEQKLWNRLNRKMSYGEEVFIAYKDGKDG
jgi:hypothetical protein